MLSLNISKRKQNSFFTFLILLPGTGTQKVVNYNKFQITEKQKLEFLMYTKGGYVLKYTCTQNIAICL